MGPIAVWPLLLSKTQVFFLKLKRKRKIGEHLMDNFPPYFFLQSEQNATGGDYYMQQHDLRQRAEIR